MNFLKFNVQIEARNRQITALHLQLIRILLPPPTPIAYKENQLDLYGE